MSIGAARTYYYDSTYAINRELSMEIVACIPCNSMTTSKRD